MRQENRFSFYVIWHLIWALLIAYVTAFVLLHGYSLYYTGLSYFAQDAVWRTISYVIPKWHWVIIPVGIIITGLSFPAHKLLRKLTNQQTVDIGWLELVAIFGLGFFLLVFQFYSIYIFAPVLGECLILNGIDMAWDKRLEETPKNRKHR